MDNFGLRKKYWPFYVIIALSVLLIPFFLYDWWPPLRGGHGWRWPYSAPQIARLVRLLPALLVITLYLLAVRKLRTAPPLLYLICCFLGSMVVPVALLFWWGDPLELLFTRTVSGLITGGFSVAAKIDGLDALLRGWLSMMNSLKPETIHVALSLPGWPVTYHGLARLLDVVPGISSPLGMMLRPYLCNNVPVMNLSNAQLASAWLGILSPLWAALTIIPLYYLGRSSAEEAVARQAIAWWPLVPSLAIFLGTLNTPTPLISTSIIYLLWGGLVQQRTGVNWRLIAAGALTAAALMFTFAFIPLLLFAGILTLITWQRDHKQPWLGEFRKPALVGLQFGIGFLTIFVVYTLFSGHTPFDALATSLAIHLDLNRAYWPWLWLHSWDFIIFVGLPAFGLFVIGLTHWARPHIRQLAVSVILTLVIVVLSGTARGETGRLWIIFMPLVILVAADILIQLPKGLRWGLLVTQTVWLFALFVVLPAIGRGFIAPPAYEDIAFAPSDGLVTPAAVDFKGELRLEGYAAEYDAHENVFVVDLYWRPERQIAVPYFFSALLVAPDGTVTPALDWQPFDYQYPTTCWRDSGTPLIDRIRLPVAENSTPGDYWLSLSVFYMAADGEIFRLPASLPDGGQDTQVGLGPLTRK